MSKTIKDSTAKEKKISVQRVQTGIRLEKRLLKVLKALAEYFDMTLGDLLEGIVLHAFEGKSAFTSEKTLEALASTLTPAEKMLEQPFDVSNYGKASKKKTAKKKTSKKKTSRRSSKFS